MLENKKENITKEKEVKDISKIEDKEAEMEESDLEDLKDGTKDIRTEYLEQNSGILFITPPRFLYRWHSKKNLQGRKTRRKNSVIPFVSYIYY